MTDQNRKMMGFETPGDQRVTITVREWNGLRLALWRSKTAWEIVTNAADEILESCVHLDGCPGAMSETEPCLPEVWAKPDDGEAVRTQAGCPDRERRMSALVILNAARMFAPLDARKAAADPYTAPSREYFSEILSALCAAQIELEALRTQARNAGLALPAPEPQSPQLEGQSP